MKKLMKMMACMVALMMVVSSSAFAGVGTSGSFDVTVTVSSIADMTITGGPIALGTMNVQTSAMSSSAIVITNCGTGANQTYSLSVTNPGDLTCTSSDPGVDEYRLLAMFNSTQPGSWEPMYQALTTTLALADDMYMFMGDQTGYQVPGGVARNLWVRFDGPSGMTATGQQTITVNITCQVD